MNNLTYKSFKLKTLTGQKTIGEYLGITELLKD